MEGIRGGKVAGVTYRGRLGLQQRVLPMYRAPFFDALASACVDGLGVFTGEPRPDEAIATGKLQVAHPTPAHNYHLLGGPFYLCWQAGLLRWLAEWDPSAVVVEANPRYLGTPGAMRWMHQRGRPVVGWGLGAPTLSGALAGVRQSRRARFLGQFDALITYSQRGKEEYAHLGFPLERIFVAPNAAAPRPIVPIPVRPADLPGKPCLIFVGRLQARKRVDMLLQACAALEEQLQPRLVIAGDGPERSILESLARRVYPGAEFVGAKYGAGLAPYLTAADLFVLPGTGGLAVQEAMSFGLPVVMGQGDGTNEDLVRAGNGWQIPPDDLEALTGTLRTALSDTAKLRRMGAESYRIVSEEINLEKMVEVFVTALNSVSN